MNYKDFSSKIKTKYPQYSDMDDKELAEKISAKYPQYQVEYDDATPAQPSPEPQKQSYLGGLGQYWTKDIPEAVGGAAERTGQRFENILKPTVLGEKAVAKTGLGGLAGEAVRSVAGTPERIGRTVGAAVGTAGELPGVAMELGGKALKNISGGKIDLGKIAESAGEQISKTETAQKAAKWWGGLPEADKANLTAAIDMVDLLSYGGGKAAEKGLKEVGKKVTTTGKKFLGGDLKIKDTLAKRGYGSRIDVKKQNIIDNIVKYGLEDPTGNFSSMADKASKLARSKVDEADNILKAVAAAPDAPVGQFVDDAIFDVYKKIDDIAAVGKEAEAEAVFNKIINGAYQKGFTGDKGVLTLVDFKRKLDPDGNLFRMGPALSDADNLDRDIRKRLYRSTVEKIKEISPEAAQLNRQAKELIDIQNVAGDAASRTANRNQFLSLPNLIVGGAGAGGAMTAQSPESALKTLAGTAATMGTIKALGQGRGAAGVIRSGEALQSLGRAGVAPYAAAGAASDATRGRYDKNRNRR